MVWIACSCRFRFVGVQAGFGVPAGDLPPRAIRTTSAMSTPGDSVAGDNFC